MCAFHLLSYYRLSFIPNNFLRWFLFRSSSFVLTAVIKRNYGLFSCCKSYQSTSRVTKSEVLVRQVVLYLMTHNFLPCDQATGASPSCSTEVKNWWSVTSILPTGYHGLVFRHRDNFWTIQQWKNCEWCTEEDVEGSGRSHLKAVLLSLTWKNWGKHEKYQSG